MSDAGVVIGIDVHSAKQEEILMMDPSITPSDGAVRAHRVAVAKMGDSPSMRMTAECTFGT